MAKTLNQIQKQIATLQKQAESLKARDLPGVVERIREAVAYYGITAADVFESGGGVARKAARKVGVKRVGARKSPKRKSPLPPKFRDDLGNAWSGHGKRPNWYKDAIAAGKTPDDLMVK